MWLFVLMVTLHTISHSHAEVRSPPDITEPLNSSVSYETSSSNFTIKCRANSKPNNPTYKWLKGTSPIVPNANVTYDPTTGDLIFTGFTKRDEGVYMCLASTVFTAQGGVRITAASFSPTVTVYQIRVEPFTDTTQTSKSVDEYSYVNLECANQGEVVGSDIAFNWYKDLGSKQLNSDGGRLHLDLLGNVHFTYVKKSDQTESFSYLCGIMSTTDKVARFGGTHKLLIKEVANRSPVAPQLQYTNTGQEAFLHDKAVLECVFSGYDQRAPHIPSIKWSMNDSTPITSNNKYSISNYGRRLTISALKEQDENNYYCSAESSAGNVSAIAVFLNVTSAPIFVDGPKDQTVTEGKDVVFNCDARSASNEQAPSAPTWYINGEATGSHTEQIKYVIENKKLTVKSVTKARDILCVQCSVTNSQGTVWGDGCLNVLLPITITQQPHLEQRIDYGDVIDLTVIATTDESQTLAYRWLHLRNEITSNGTEPRFLTIDPVTHATTIKTSLLSNSEYETVEGIYRRIISHKYDVVHVDVLVILKVLPEYCSESYIHGHRPRKVLYFTF